MDWYVQQINNMIALVNDYQSIKMNMIQTNNEQHKIVQQICVILLQIKVQFTQTPIDIATNNIIYNMYKLQLYRIAQVLRKHPKLIIQNYLPTRTTGVITSQNH